MPGRIFTATAGDHGIRAPLPGDQNLNVRSPLTRGLLSAWIFNHASDRFVPDIGPVGCNIDTLLSAQPGYGPGKLVHPNGAGYFFPTSSNGSTASTVTAPVKERHANLTSGPMSVVLRIYGDFGPASAALAFGKATAGSVATGWGVMFDDTSATPNFEFWIGCNTSEFKAISVNVSLRQWYDVAIVYNGSTAASPPTSLCQFYINGSAVGSSGTPANGSGAINDDSATTMKFGGDGSANFVSATVSIAHAYIYNRLLSAADVKALAETPYAICTQPVARRWFSLSTSSAVANTVSLFATQSQSALRQISVGATHAVSQTQPALLTRLAARGFSASESVTATLTRMTASTRSATQTATSVLTALKTTLTALTATQSAAALQTRVTQATRVASESTTAAVTKTVNWLRTAVQSQTASRTIQAQTARSTTQRQTAVQTRVVGAIKIAVQAQTATFVKTANRILIATEGQTASLVRRINRLVIATSGQTATMLRTTGRILTATVAQAATQARQVNIIRIATQATTALLTAFKGASSVGASLFASQATTAIIVRQVALIRAVGTGTASTLTRLTAAIRTTTQSTATTVSRAMSAVRTVGQATSATLRLLANRTLLSTQATTAFTVSLKVFLRALTATQATATFILRQAALIRTASQSTTSVVTRATASARTATQSTTAIVLRTTLVIRLSTQATASLIGRAVARGLIAVQATSATFASLRVFLRVLTATQATSALIVRQATAVRAASQATTARLLRVPQVIKQAVQATSAQILRAVTLGLRSASQGTTARLATNLTVVRTLIGTQVTTAVLSSTKVLLRALVAIQATVAIVFKQTGVTRAAAQATAVVQQRAIAAVRIASQTQAVTVRRAVGRTLAAASQATAASVTRAMARTVTAVQSIFGRLSALFQFGQPRKLSYTASAVETDHVYFGSVATTFTAVAQTQTSLTSQASAVTVLPYAEATRSAVGYWRLGESEGYAQAVLSSTPVAYYRLATDATDSSGNGRNGAVVGGVSFGQAGSLADGNLAARFDGVSTTVINTFSDTSVIVPTAAWTLEAWFKQGGNNGGVLITRANSRPALLMSGSFASLLVVDAASVQVQLLYAVSLFDGLYHHVCGTYDGTNLRLFVDGVLRAGPTPSNAYGLPSSTQTWRIGGRTDGAIPCDGFIDEAAIYPYALSAGQIANNYALRTSTIATVSAATVTDSSGNGQTGTVTGGVTFGQPGRIADGNAAVSFDGTGYITIADAAQQNPGLGSYSYEAWVKRAAGISASEFILCKAFGAGVNTGGGELFIANSGGFVSRLNNAIQVNSATGFADGQFHHVVVSMDRVANIGQMYVDGVASGAAVDLSTGSGANLSGSGFPLLIGKRPAGNFFNGVIDELVIYNYALSAQQAADHFALSSFGRTVSLTATASRVTTFTFTASEAA